ncbi:MAG: peptidyl-alpha-hydroxyglycine alpha-amidating lyase family protein [Steroidobacteraceae bacterium]
MAQLGTQPFCYVVEPDWGRLPDGLIVGDVAGIAIDGNDNVYIFNRGDHPMIVLDRHGSIIRTWGEGVFTRPHGVHVGHDGYVYCTDDGDHTVRKFTVTGVALLQIGIVRQAATAMSGNPFNRCTHTALAPGGEIYISDGYGNAHVHLYSADGRHLRTWGGGGSEPGQFNLPHNICCDEDGWVYVADRENNRVQIFDGRGQFETQWTGLRRPCAMCIEPRRRGNLYIGELAVFCPLELLPVDEGPRLSVIARDGHIEARLGGRGPGLSPTELFAPHGIAVDSLGNIFLGEVIAATWGHYFPGRSLPAKIKAFRKLTRVSATSF